MFGKSGPGKTATLLAFLAQFLAGGSQVYLVDSKNELQALSNVPTTCLWSRRPFYARLCCSSNTEQQEDFQGKKGTSGTFRTQELADGTYSASGHPSDELRAVWLLRKQRKSKS